VGATASPQRPPYKPDSTKPFLTIIDTHVTTVVSAFFLFLFGTGLIRGRRDFADHRVIANVFTAIYVSKTIFQYHLAKRDRQRS